MSILSNFFGNSSTPASQKQEPAQQKQSQQSITDPANNTQQSNPSGIMPTGTNNQTPSGEQKVENPLDVFNGMFDTKTTDQDKAPSFSLPQDRLDKVANSQNFLQNMPQELTTRVQAGDTSALMEMMNLVGQNAYKNALSHQSQLSDAFVTSRMDFADKSFGGRVKQELTTSELGNTPGFSHPVVKAQLTKVAQDLARQYPDASPQQIAQQAKDYITTLAQAINPELSGNKSATKDSKAAEVTDWGAYLG